MANPLAIMCDSDWHDAIRQVSKAPPYDQRQLEAIGRMTRDRQELLVLIREIAGELGRNACSDLARSLIDRAYEAQR